jgi:hypothetical protein
MTFLFPQFSRRGKHWKIARAASQLIRAWLGADCASNQYWLHVAPNACVAITAKETPQTRGNGASDHISPSLLRKIQISNKV